MNNKTHIKTHNNLFKMDNKIHNKPSNKNRIKRIKKISINKNQKNIKINIMDQNQKMMMNNKINNHNLIVKRCFLVF